MNNFFIPVVVEINGTKVPSTPFKSHDNKPIFLGDVFEVNFDQNDPTGQEVYVSTLNDEGQYVGTCKNQNKVTPIWMFDHEIIINLGSSIEKPELLDLLTH